MPTRKAKAQPDEQGATGSTRKEPLTTGDLSWFDLAKYDKQLLKSIGLQGWLGILRDRLWIRYFLEQGDKGAAAQLFEVVKSDPTRSHFGDVSPLITPHKLETPTVFSTRAGLLRTLAKDADALNLGWLDFYDLPAANPVMGLNSPFVTLHVNLSTTKEVIKRDFGAWLDAIHPMLVASKTPGKKRQTRSRIFTGKAAPLAEWADHQYLPFYDLELYADTRGTSVPEALMIEMLELGRDADGTVNLKTPRKSRDVFSSSTVFNMWLQLRSKVPRVKARKRSTKTGGL